MPNIISCFKWVIDEAYIKTGPSLKLDLSFVDYKISDYDKNAIEEGVLLQEKYGGSVAVITVGRPEDTRGLKDALSRGPEKAYFVNDPSFSDLEPGQTASIMAGALKDRIPFDIILCGEGSSDIYAQQVGPRLAEKLDIPCICYANSIQIQDNQVLVERRVDDGVELVQVAMPVLISVSPDINTPRIPGLKDTLGASKKPVTEIAAAELGASFPAHLESMETRAASLERSGHRLGGDQAGIKNLVEALLKEGAI